MKNIDKIKFAIGLILIVQAKFQNDSKSKDLII